MASHKHNALNAILKKIPTLETVMHHNTNLDFTLDAQKYSTALEAHSQSLEPGKC